MLNEEEIKAGRQLIAQYRKYGRGWRVARWLFLLAGLLMLVLMVFAYWQMEMLQKGNTSAEFPVQGMEPAHINSVLDARIDLLRLESKLHFAVMLHASVGGLLLVMGVFGWGNRGAQALLKAKLLETALKNEEAANRSFEFMRDEDA
jgi:hypothetical protein